MCSAIAAAVNPSPGPNFPSDDDAPGLGAPPSGPLVPPPSMLTGAVDGGGSEDEDVEAGAWVVALPDEAGVGVSVTTMLLTIVLSCRFGPRTISVVAMVERMRDADVGVPDWVPF